MSYELNLNSSCELLLTINLPSGLNSTQLKLIDHSRSESVINSSQYTITDNVLTYTIPSSLYNIEGNFGYYVVATGYESEHIDINAHLCNAINNCQQIEITSGEYSLCIKNNYQAIIESWSNANGNWTKWSDGTMIITQRYTVVSATANVSMGSLFRIGLKIPPDYPIPFVGDIPTVNITLHNCWLGWLMGIESNASLTNPTGGNLVPMACATNKTFENIVINITSIGRWK